MLIVLILVLSELKVNKGLHAGAFHLYYNENDGYQQQGLQQQGRAGNNAPYGQLETLGYKVKEIACKHQGKYVFISFNKLPEYFRMEMTGDLSEYIPGYLHGRGAEEYPPETY